MSSDREVWTRDMMRTEGALDVELVECKTEELVCWPVARPIHSRPKPLSPWSESAAKRAFDCVLVLAMLPILVPLLLSIAIAIRLTSPGRILFRQSRIGKNGNPFTILKFRTMIDSGNVDESSITTVDNPRITPAGRILRYWKLDELPQVLNVLCGEMSLVGPRPKVPEQQRVFPTCRPGITGAASIAFAREETFLAQLPKHDLDTYYYGTLIDLKRRMDNDYMTRATIASDFLLLCKTVLRQWGDASEIVVPAGQISRAAVDD